MSQRISQGWSEYLKWLVRHTACYFLVCLISAVNAQEIPIASTTSGESILVRRDFSVVTPAVITELGSNGVVLESGALVPWFDVLGAQNWQLKNSQGQKPISSTDVVGFQQKYGQPWFLVRSRLARGETLEVASILKQLAEADPVGQPLASQSIAARYYLAWHLAQQDEISESWLQWLMARSSLEKAIAADGSSPNAAAWLELYVAPLNLSDDSIVHLPQTLAFPRRWDEHQLERLRTGADQPAAALCWVAAQLCHSPTFSRGELAEVITRSLPQANVDQRELLNSCLQTLERIDRWQADAALLASDETRYSYLDTESKWAELGRAANPSELERQKLIWQLRLEALFLSKQTEARLNEAGQLRLLLLEHWGYKTAAVSK